MSAPLLELDKISYSYPGEKQTLLKNLSLLIDREQIGIIGPNGVGKTTLFSIIMGLIKPDSGEILHKGKEIQTDDDIFQLRSTVGYLFQNSDDQLFSPTVLEDVAFGPLNHGATPAEAKEISVHTLKQLGLQGFEERITHKLSGGEKKLVALATILSMEPEMLLLDEPSNNLDPTTRERLITILREQDLPHVIISHDLDFLTSTCSRFYTIHGGQLLHCTDNQLHSHKHIHPCGEKAHEHET